MPGRLFLSAVSQHHHAAGLAAFFWNDTMKPLRILLACLAGLALAFAAPVRAQEKISIAAAAELQITLDEIVVQFKRAHPLDSVTVTYGASDKLYNDIRQGAPFDMYFSANIMLARTLAASGFSGSGIKPYAVGRLVLWSTTRDASALTLQDLANPSISTIALANPRQGPYGKIAEQALRATGLWEQLEPKLVYADSVAQSALVVRSGQADVGLISWTLAIEQKLAAKGAYRLIEDRQHQPIKQGYMITQRAAGSALAHQFADFMDSPDARTIMVRHGFVLPGEKPVN
jgi:molybdate transport system substrate-binding protein